MSKPKWRRQIERDLKNWKKYKAFVKAVEIEKELRPEANMSYRFKDINTQENQKTDRTADKALKGIEEEDEEYIEKKIFIRKLDVFVSSLPLTQEYIIRSKYYMFDEDFDRTQRYGGETRPDKVIWNDPEFGYQERRYFELKKEALKELAQKMGYI